MDQSSDDFKAERVTLVRNCHLFGPKISRELNVESPGKLTRRQIILAGLGAIAAGCSETPLVMQQRPRPNWPTQMPQPRQDYTTAYQQPLPPRPAPQPAPQSTYHQRPTYTQPTPSFSYRGQNVPSIIPRSAWAKMSTITSRVNPMNGINRITLHHEGWEVVNFTDVNTTMTRLQHIQRFHMKDRGWGDVGYHFIIDRAGRIWEARPLKYQGAHVHDENEHNVGIMLLGNFEKQLPSNVQLASAQTMTSFIMEQYNVPVHRVYTHQELKPTRCPGRNLQPRLVAMRQSGYLG